jgi:hypothetical protein
MFIKAYILSVNQQMCGPFRLKQWDDKESFSAVAYDRPFYQPQLIDWLMNIEHDKIITGRRKLKFYKETHHCVTVSTINLKLTTENSV